MPHKHNTVIYLHGTTDLGIVCPSTAHALSDAAIRTLEECVDKRHCEPQNPNADNQRLAGICETLKRASLPLRTSSVVSPQQLSNVMTKCARLLPQESFISPKSLLERK
ncbi:hypothetical protein V8G54_033496 [Vigna mungo]|uniref:Uncharacterized protein n=1 Tax=Vigna mungo TaxID=3915 RepID=A0AAQ3RJ11_VIGMU